MTRLNGKTPVITGRAAAKQGMDAPTAVLIGVTAAIIPPRPSPPTCKPFFNTRWRSAMFIRPVRSRRAGLAVARGHLIDRLAEQLDQPSRVPEV